MHVCSVLVRFGRSHRRWFIGGILGALVVVGMRVALPWPLRALADPWLSQSGSEPAGLLSLVPPWLDPLLAMSGIFLLLMVGLGFADHMERLFFARFSIGTVRDLRAEAFKAALRTDRCARSMGTGDLVARLIGDTARIKTGLKGFLVHVATNGGMFLGITIVLVCMNLALGLIFAVASLAVGALTLFGALRIFRIALKYRRKEGELADTVHQTWGDDPHDNAFASVNDSSGAYEASLTRLQGMTTWGAHAILGFATATALWVGLRGVSNGHLAGGDVLVLMMYALMLRTQWFSSHGRAPAPARSSRAATVSRCY